MKLVYLTKGHKAIVDNSVFSIVSKNKWYADVKKNGAVYAARSVMDKGKKKKIYLHHIVVGRKEGMVCDHKNGNTLDNRKCNLRLCSHRENIRNSKMNINNKSGFIGVRLHPQKRKWQAYIVIDGKWTHLGYFILKEDAAKIRAAIEKKMNWRFKKD